MIIGIITGILAGFIASKLTSGSGKGCIIDLLLGLLGGFVGGTLFELLGIGPAYNWLGELITSICGAVAVLWIWNKIR
ncbi:MAG: GlsB/YeaQ/YmgE family stress response membrane protein [Prevotella sp.]|jgi:uncharacterized membrane protein YeaQ/YmgE (transglycosylase-associated protein family)|nr:GlsB/YeaQ/YmgE family stress response membrane protein [Prevotella sp.]